MKTKLKLTILAEDILKSNYLTSNSCAITKALARAGRKDLKDNGTLTRQDEFQCSYGAPLAQTTNNRSYFELTHKVLCMYATKENSEIGGYIYSPEEDALIVQIPIEDFEHELIFEESLVVTE
jgi:hypothetical protein